MHTREQWAAVYASPPQLKMKFDIWQTQSRPRWIANIEDTSENAQWRKVKQVQPAWLFHILYFMHLLEMKCDIWQTQSRSLLNCKHSSNRGELLIWIENEQLPKCNISLKMIFYFVKVIKFLLHLIDIQQSLPFSDWGLQIRKDILQNHKSWATFEDLELNWIYVTNIVNPI